MTEVPISEKTYFNTKLHYVFPCSLRRSVIATAGHCPTEKEGDTYENKKWRIIYRGSEDAFPHGSQMDYVGIHKATDAKFRLRFYNYVDAPGWAVYIAKEEHDKIARKRSE